MSVYTLKKFEKKIDDRWQKYSKIHLLELIPNGEQIRR